MNEYKTKLSYKDKYVWGAELAHSAHSRKKKEGLIVFFPAAIHSAPAGHTPRSVPGPDANGPGLLRAGPSGEEQCTPYLTVPVSPQCPQEIGLPTLPVFQGTAVSSKRFSQSLLPRNVAELGGSPPLWGSLEQLDRPSLAGPPLQGTELAALSTPEASLERLVPLVGHLAVWEPLPSVSHWVLPKQTLVILVFLGDDAGLRTVVSNMRLLRQS